MNEFLQTQIPEKCRTCPVQAVSAEKIDKTNEMIDNLTTLAMQDVHVEIVGEQPEMDITAEDLENTFRKSCGDQVETLNLEITAIKKTMAKLAFSCFGPAVLTGEVNRRALEVTLCASGSNPPEPIQPAGVKSTRI